MNTKLTKFQFLIIVVAVGAFASQLVINAYYELRGSLVNLDVMMKNEIDTFYKSQAYTDRYTSDTAAISEWQKELDQKRARNAIELKKPDGRMIYYGESIQAPQDSIKLTNRERQAWLAMETERIRAKYDKAGKSWLNQWGGFGLIFVFESLALVFGFLAPRRQKIYTIFGHEIRLEFWCAIAASLYAQRTSCIITEKGLFLLLGDQHLAETYSLAFMFLTPFFYWVGGMDIEEHGKLPVATMKVTERKESIEFSKKHTISETQQEVPVKPSSPDEAIDLYAQKKIGPPNWSQRRIANEYFGGKTTHVNNLIKQREVELARFEEV